MKIKEFFQKKSPVISFEFFPPKTDEGSQNLLETVTTLREFRPSFVSITYGAGGNTRAKTVQLVSKIKNEIGIETMAHLTCVGHTREEILNILKELESEGIESVLALRGDPPQGRKNFPANPDGLNHASDLVKLIRKGFEFGVGVAGYPEKHPEAPTWEEDLRHLKEKVDAGADFVITQLFFINRDYFSFVEKARKIGIQVPIVPGIMPIKDVEQIKRFTVMCGAKIPDKLLRQLENVKNDGEEVVRLGVDYATEQCMELLKKGAPGIHFYTLNKSQSTREIFRRLKEAGMVP